MLKIKPEHHPKGQKVGALGQQTETDNTLFYLQLSQVFWILCWLCWVIND